MILQTIQIKKEEPKIDPSKIKLNLLIQKLKNLSSGFYEILVKKQKRTSRQNRLYWKQLHFLAHEVGENPENLHEFFKGKFLKRTKILNIDGNISGISTIKSTTKLTTKEFSEYLEEIEKFVAEFFGFNLPDPKYFGLDEEMFFNNKK